MVLLSFGFNALRRKKIRKDCTSMSWSESSASMDHSTFNSTPEMIIFSSTTLGEQHLYMNFA